MDKTFLVSIFFLIFSSLQIGIVGCVPAFWDPFPLLSSLPRLSNGDLDMTHRVAPRTLCTTSEFRCDSGFCIRLAYKCDRDNDCGNGEDEVGCTTYTGLSTTTSWTTSTTTARVRDADKYSDKSCLQDDHCAWNRRCGPGNQYGGRYCVDE